MRASRRKNPPQTLETSTFSENTRSVIAFPFIRIVLCSSSSRFPMKFASPVAVYVFVDSVIAS